MSAWRRRIERLPERAPELPLRPAPASNGEFVPAATTPHQRAVAATILDRVEQASRRSGIDRRRLLQSSVGVAASLAAFNACSRSQPATNDLVALSRRYPEMQFVVYHGTYELETRERAYDPGAGRAGIDDLVRALEDHGVGPNENVWAELGTTWREVLRDPDEAAHVLGKLLRYVGEDRVLWGTDAIWYGSPQPHIMAFRAFQISGEYQERLGYPPLTDDLKRKVLGLNAAALLGLDPQQTRCALDGDGLDAARAEHAAMVTEGAIPTPWQARGPLTRREVVTWLATLRQPWQP